MSGAPNRYRYTRPQPSPSLAVRAFEFNNECDRAARRERAAARRRRWKLVEPVACPVDGTALLPGQVCLTCGALEVYRDGPA